MREQPPRAGRTSPVSSWRTRLRPARQLRAEAAPEQLRLDPALLGGLLGQRVRPAHAGAAPWSRGPPPRPSPAARRPGQPRRRRARRAGRRARPGAAAAPRPPSTVRAVRQSSMARGSPTMSTSGLVPVRSGTSPSAGSFMQSFASSASIRRSQARASWKPAPMAWPCTAAIETIAGSAQPQVAGLVAGHLLLEIRIVGPGDRLHRSRPRRAGSGRSRRRTTARRRGPPRP